MGQGFEGDEHRRVVESPTPCSRGGVAQGDDLGVGEGVVVSDAAVVAAPDDDVVEDQHSADGYVAVRGRVAGLDEGLQHERFVGHGSDVVGHAGERKYTHLDSNQKPSVP